MRTQVRLAAAALIAAAMITTIYATMSSASPGSATPSHTRAPAAPGQAGDPDPEDVPVPPPLSVGINASTSPRLVDNHGRTLYIFSLDRARKSACDAACARVWWPVRSLGGKPQPAADVAADRIGSMQRADGSDQVTYRGFPLYYSVKDRAAGDHNGEGTASFGGTWTALPPTTNAPAK